MHRIVWAGRVRDDDLPALYGGARAFTYPSLSEGFGLQVLEAMACGCAVVTSDRSALQEVADDAALLVDPERPAAIGDALCALTDEDEVARLRERGLERARQFDWEVTAQATLDVYRRALD